MKRPVLSLLATFLLLSASAAQAALYRFEVNLLGASENPPVVTAGNGSGTIDIDTAAFTMAIDVTFADLLGLTTAAHIHCCALPSANAMVATQTPSFVGFPLGVSSGAYQQLFDMTLGSSYNPAFLTLHAGDPEAAFAALTTAMLGGLTYFNIHSTRFPGGEIRGQLIQVSEPASLALLCIALAGLGALRRRAAAH